MMSLGSGGFGIPMQMLLSIPASIRLPFSSKISSQPSTKKSAAVAAAVHEILAPSSLSMTLSSLKRSGHLGQLIRDCQNDLSNLLASERLLSNGGWHTSYVSTHSFDTNNTTGHFPDLSPHRRPLDHLSTPRTLLFARTLDLNRVQLNFSRGFRSRRYESMGTIPFKKEETGSGGEEVKKDEGGVELKMDEGFDPEKILKRARADPEIYRQMAEALNKKRLNPEDSRLVAASIHGFAAGNYANNKSSEKSGSFMKQKLWLFITSAALVSFLAYFIVQKTTVIFKDKGFDVVEPEDIKVTFEDVKGCDEAKEELQVLVEFLKNPLKFGILGGKLPKGCLMDGPPGNGKTLLAKAVAAEAGVPFFSVSGSEFDEIFVGQGSKRIRQLFSSARAKSPCVIFIDEIDSVGRKRSTSPIHPYANQTINQLLSEMDGFESSEGVIVLGATNMVDNLDKALLRPGRFDTRVRVTKPDRIGRQQILQLYLSKVEASDSIDVEKLSSITIGMSGAEIESLVNTAAIKAAKDDKNCVSMADINFALDKQKFGTEWTSRKKALEQLRNTAYHEAGHAIVAYFTESAMPLYKVTIASKGQSLGHAAFLPPDRDSNTKAEILAQMDVSMGGRAAEEIVFGKDKVTAGASSDLEAATRSALGMVKYLGMSEKIGLRVYPTDDGKPNDLGPKTSELIDAEVNKILNDSYDRAIMILKTHRKGMDLLVDALLQYETLDAEDLKAILDGNPENVKAKMSSTNKSIKGDEKSGGGGGGKTIPAEGAANLPGSQRPREILSVT